jgi:hypothetical protein
MDTLHEMVALPSLEEVVAATALLDNTVTNMVNLATRTPPSKTS